MSVLSILTTHDRHVHAEPVQWLNSDRYPRSRNVLHLDATKRFPLDDASFDHVFSEHMIEHIPLADGLAMLRECHRVLKPGGTVRISTPDLRFLIALCDDDKSELQKGYVAWATDTFVPEAPSRDEVFVINNFMRAWGHSFIYDEKALRDTLQRAGFSEICKCELNESEHEALRNLENVGRMPTGFLRLESMTLEATK